MAKAKPRNTTKKKIFTANKQRVLPQVNSDLISHSHDWAQQALDHRNDLKERHQFVQSDSFIDLRSEISGQRYPFVTVEAEVPKFWRGDRAFFHPFRIELTWRQSGRRRVGYFKPKSDRYFVAVNSLEPIIGSDNKAWIREFPHPVRDVKKMLSAEALSLIEEFSETEQTLSLRVIVPLGCFECEGFLFPLELKLRYPGINHADLVFEYTRRIISSSGNIKFTLTEEDVIKYSEVVLKETEVT